MRNEPDSQTLIVVAGHICLDIIPRILVQKPGIAELIQPGKLLNVGPVTTSTGGAVANTGLALHKLGMNVRMAGKVGADPFGEVLLYHIRSVAPELAAAMIVDAECNTSYTVVINPPGIDRAFLHCPGANDTYGAPDLDEGSIGRASLFHFGYPPLMRRLYSDGGGELRRIFERASSAVTSLDMAMPDPDSDAGRADWGAILCHALPEVDIFLPSLDEILAMLRMPAEADCGASARRVAEWAIGAGAAVVGIKMGDKGLYLRTTADRARLAKMESRCGCRVEDWAGREFWAPCFHVDVAGTTGSGDATIAGFLSAVASGEGPCEAAIMATAVGACACETPDATGGIRTRKETLARISAGWKKHDISPSPTGWKWDEDRRLWIGPAEQH